nr:hypothetical protein [Halorussus halophilus]
MANELGHSKSTIHSHLRTLEERKILVRECDEFGAGKFGELAAESDAEATDTDESDVECTGFRVVNHYQWYTLA